MKHIADWSTKARRTRVDFAKSFLPERIAGVRGITCLNDDERRQLNQIRGNSYCHIFAFVEEYIVPMVLANTTRDIYGDDRRGHCCASRRKSSKHQEMLRRAGEQFEKGFGSPVRADPRARGRRRGRARTSRR